LLLVPYPFCSDALNVTPSVPAAAAGCTQKRQGTAVGDCLNSIEGELEQLCRIGQAEQLVWISAWQGSFSYLKEALKVSRSHELASPEVTEDTAAVGLLTV
jgi:hypothetical protein